MATRIAWLLNLDADDELADPRHYRPSAAVERRIAELRDQLVRLLDPSDRVIGVDADCAQLGFALAFCPTPSALARIAAAGLAVPPAPPLSVLARVNGRGFCAELGQTLPSARYVQSWQELEQVLTLGQPGRVWLLKRGFSFAGRERRQVRGAELDVPTLGFVRRTFAKGQGLQVEPLLPRTADFAQHGYVFRGGQAVFGAPSSQTCDARGAWRGSREVGPGELDDRERSTLQHHLEQTAEALAQAGYFGPFGIDAFRYLDPVLGAGFQPRCEVNARFSMGYPRALLEQALAMEPSGSQV